MTCETVRRPSTSHRCCIPTYATLSYDKFLHDHLIPNKPLILSAENSARWQAAQTWRKGSPRDDIGSSSPNLTALQPFGHHVVPVADTTKRYFSEFEREEYQLGKLLHQWEKGDGNGLYVKDWHLLETLESEGKGVEEVYGVPDCFQDDWLNPSHTPSRRLEKGSLSDFRFCYVGGPGTFTPLHRDVYGSYSWSANVVGRKSWWLYPPGSVDGLRDKHGELPFDVREVDGGRESGAIQVIQQEGEIIFVPSGWYHQVVNMDFCISINHNFASSITLPHMFNALEVAQARVEDSIPDVRNMIQLRLGTDGPAWKLEWVESVQGLLEKDFGWGWRGFWEMILRNIKARPAAPEVSAPVDVRNKNVRFCISQFEDKPEWTFLHDVRGIVQEVASITRC